MILSVATFVGPLANLRFFGRAHVLAFGGVYSVWTAKRSSSSAGTSGPRTAALPRDDVDPAQGDCQHW